MALLYSRSMLRLGVAQRVSFLRQSRRLLSTAATRPQVSLWLHADDWVTRLCEHGLFHPEDYSVDISMAMSQKESLPEQYTLRILHDAAPPSSSDSPLLITSLARPELEGIHVVRQDGPVTVEPTLRFNQGTVLEPVQLAPSAALIQTPRDGLVEPSVQPGGYFWGRLRGFEGWVSADDITIAERSAFETAFARMCLCVVPAQDDRQDRVKGEMECYEWTSLGDLAAMISEHSDGASVSFEDMGTGRVLAAETELNALLGGGWGSQGMPVQAIVDGEPFALNGGLPLVCYRATSHPRYVELAGKSTVASAANPFNILQRFFR